MPDELNDKVRLLHALESITKINEYVGDIDLESFQSNSMMKDACIRQLGIIGEACNRISEEIKSDNPKIEWRQIIGLRNIVIHQYFGVDDRVIWDILQFELPDLKVKLEIILKNLG